MGVPKIVVIGSLNIDFVTVTPRMPVGGETHLGTSMSVQGGGKGANQAVACGNAAFVSPITQDCQVELIGAVGGDDPFYEKILRPELQKSGVGHAGVVEVEGVQTGTATIIVDQSAEGQNRIIVVAGANRRVANPAALLETSKQGGMPDVAILQGEIPKETVMSLLVSLQSEADEICVVFNPAPVFAGGMPLACLRDLTVLVMNETECIQMFRVVEELHGVELSENHLTEEETLYRLTKILHTTAGIRIVIVTLGSIGVYYSASWSSQRGLVPAERVKKVIDTTAAGDTFIGYFSTAIARHWVKERSFNTFDLEAAIKRAVSASALCVQRSGAMESIPFGYEIDS